MNVIGKGDSERAVLITDKAAQATGTTWRARTPSRVIHRISGSAEGLARQPARQLAAELDPYYNKQVAVVGQETVKWSTDTGARRAATR